MKRRIPNFLLLALFLLVGGLLGVVGSRSAATAPQDRTITITARKYAYDPPIIKVNRGDRVHIRFAAQDVTHGFFLEGYDLDAKARPENPSFWLRRPSQGGAYNEVEEISFVANRGGKFRYRCSMTCGYMHPFMQGELIVAPNYLFFGSLGLTLGLGLGMLVIFRRAPQTSAD